MSPTQFAHAATTAPQTVQLYPPRDDTRRVVEPSEAGSRKSQSRFEEDVGPPVVRLVRRSVQEFARAAEILAQKEAESVPDPPQQAGRGEVVDEYA